MANTIDDVLASVGLGRYQIRGCVLFGLMLAYSNVSPMTYVFTASDQKYRCEIPECDAPDRAERTYEPGWLGFTTPHRNDSAGLVQEPFKCARYSPAPGNGSIARCVPAGFVDDRTEPCGRWVFEDLENTIGTEFGLMCEENKWKLSMVGTINNVGQFIGIPISGILADKFGRKFTMIFCATVSATICIVQSFSINYPMFLTMELMSSTVSGGLYTITFILAMEMFLAKQRVLFYSILECFIPLGSMFVALVASQVKNWKFLLQIANLPGLLFLSYFWLTEESMRWLEMQGKHDKVVEALQKIADANKKPMPELQPPPTAQKQIENSSAAAGGDKVDAKSDWNVLKEIVHSPIIFLRMIRCSLLWIVITLVYYGITINSTSIAGNKYLNFTLVSFVEMPACLFNWLIMEGMSRKMSLSSLFVLTGASCIMYNMMPDTLHLLKTVLFMTIKLGISIAFSITYILTAEIFPTSIRATMVSMCSMIGRIGSITAPLTPLLNEYFGGNFTMLIFGSAALTAAAVTMSLPESKNIKLPDTINEAEQIGVEEKKPKNIEIPL